MAHARQQILLAMQTALTGLATTGANVFLSRVAPLQRTEVPGLIVRAGAENAQALTLEAPRFFERSFSVEVVACVKAADGLDAELNQIFAEAEAALAMPVAIAGASGITLTGISRPQMAQAEEQVAAAALTYEVVYEVAENDPTTIL